MQVNVLAFGIAKEMVGGRSTRLQVNSSSVRSLMNELEQKFPELKRLSSYRIAVNEKYAEMDDEVNDGDEVAIIPPVSGG
jgi:molybdopterin converting factor subunit 1